MYYNEGLYEDNFDIFGKEHSARQFYTMPVNSIVNDQGSFAEWCYKRPPTCRDVWYSMFCKFIIDHKFQVVLVNQSK